MKKILLSVLILCFILIGVKSTLSQESKHVQDTIPKKEVKNKKNYVFGNIYVAFRYCLKDTYNPQAAFVFNQGIIGYYHRISEKVSGKIMLDVTRTTHFFEIIDTAGNQLDYSYFEGSKFTAYLKMAEIKWDINKYLTFRVGQLLSTQYLTFQDRFWGYRYVDVTFQEKFRMGMPADFGVQLDFKLKDKFLYQFSIVNGEGPFRYQDMNGKFLYSHNIQYNPIEKLTFKLYADFAPSPVKSDTNELKSVVAGFIGFKTKRFRIGGEYSYVFNHAYIKNLNYYGFSIFGSVQLWNKIEVLARYDYVTLDNPEDLTDTGYYLVGLQYEPVNMFFISANYRYYSEGSLPFIYANFGLKF
ncbi:MAG: hypothetical protein K8R86_13070 [Bacteroidales bacterium]|nr:hypothetical protein [Bacteroidales bacterium]